MSDKAEFLLKLSSTKVAKLDKELDRNWLAHLILAGIGPALVFDIGNLPGVLNAKYLSQQNDKKAVAVIMLPIALYFCMRLGYLVGAFVKARRFHDGMLERYLGDEKPEGMLALSTTTNFYELFYSPKSFAQGKAAQVVFSVVAPVVISLGQASAICLVIQAYGLNRWTVSVLGGFSALVLFLYWAFWRALRDISRTKWLLGGCVALLVVWLVLFELFVTFSLNSVTP